MTPSKNTARTTPTVKQAAFARLIAGTTPNAEAYRRIYSSKCSNQAAAERGSRVAALPVVQAEVTRIRNKVELKVILTLNDRLGILARDAQTGGDSAPDKNARARSIQVYSDISGDRAPERHEHAGPDGSPIPVAATVATRTMSRREKVEAIKAQRAAAKAAESAPITPQPAPAT